MKIAAAAYPLDFLPDWAAYEKKLTDWVGQGAAEGADLLVFPEYGAMELASLGGAAVAADLEAALHEVMAHQAAVTALHCQLAAQHGVHILGSSGPAMADGPRPVNRAVLYGPQGVIGRQDKQIMTRFEREEWDIAPGQGLKVFDTVLGKIGIIICYDSEFPLLARALVEAGAEILLAPSCTETLAGYTRVKVGAMARALENQCVTVHAPTVGPAPWCPAVDMNAGAAAIYGPPDLGFPETGILAQTVLNMPGWACAEIEPASVARVRREGAVLNHAHWNEQENRLSAAIEVVKPPYSA
ncbi:carbon-nitrogen hydrolase family protein [Roseinatronobacter alkalisoli]|uniref:Carbon-nitrogen hydrolase family protein n=1 Tax=Roseinatronobacter alkalisoli TaxID=3028235 RepID=A0ABT5T3D5_9RHOB|nr:carbon-nitrogen hydrolase family protein [Roseinatronobacter sp. HJB301]MDD7969625.1 carbon-nitrogen hydrolase family protein [Roseinatronobacter sp. HJB301]